MVSRDVNYDPTRSLFWGIIIFIMARLFRQQNEINFYPFRFVYHAFLKFHLLIRAYFRFLHWGRLSGGLHHDMVFCQCPFATAKFLLFIKHIFVIFVDIVGGCVYLYNSCFVILNQNLAVIILSLIGVHSRSNLDASFVMAIATPLLKP